MAKSIEGDDGKPIASGGTGINVPPSAWTTVRDNSLATPDAYQEEGNPEFISEFGSASSTGLAQLSNMFKGGKNAKAKIEKALSFVSSVSGALTNAGGSGNTIIDKITSLSRSTGISLSSLGINENNPIVKGISTANRLVLQIDDTYQKLRHTDFHSLSSISNLVNDLTGNNFIGLSNQLTQAEYEIGIIKEMVKYDIPNAFGILKDVFKDNEYKHQIIKETYPDIVKSQDLSSIRSMVDTVGVREFNRLTGQNNISGNFTNVISQTWNKDKERLSLSSRGVYNELKDTIKKTNPNWLYLDRNGEKTINIKDYLYASHRFRELFFNGLSNSNKIKISTDSSVNESILAEIAGNSDTTVDDEKFLKAMVIGTYTTPSLRIKTDFPKLVIEPNIVKV